MKKMIKSPLILGLVCLIAGLLLALVYNITEPVIKKNKNERENATIVEMYGNDVEITDITGNAKNDVIEAVLKVKSGASTYYVYKLVVKDGVGSDDSNCVLSLTSEGKIDKLKFTKYGDSYAQSYGDTYISGIKGKSSLADSDVVGGSTKTGNNLVDAINQAITHFGGVK